MNKPPEKKRKTDVDELWDDDEQGEEILSQALENYSVANSANESVLPVYPQDGNTSVFKVPDPIGSSTWPQSYHNIKANGAFMNKKIEVLESENKKLKDEVKKREAEQFGKDGHIQMLKTKLEQLQRERFQTKEQEAKDRSDKVNRLKLERDGFETQLRFMQKDLQDRNTTINSLQRQLTSQSFQEYQSPIKQSVVSPAPPSEKVPRLSHTPSKVSSQATSDEPRTKSSFPTTDTFLARESAGKPLLLEKVAQAPTQTTVVVKSVCEQATQVLIESEKPARKHVLRTAKVVRPHGYVDGALLIYKMLLPYQRYEKLPDPEDTSVVIQDVFYLLSEGHQPAPRSPSSTPRNREHRSNNKQEQQEKKPNHAPLKRIKLLPRPSKKPEGVPIQPQEMGRKTLSTAKPPQEIGRKTQGASNALTATKTPDKKVTTKQPPKIDNKLQCVVKAPQELVKRMSNSLKRSQTIGKKAQAVPKPQIPVGKLRECHMSLALLQNSAPRTDCIYYCQESVGNYHALAILPVIEMYVVAYTEAIQLSELRESGSRSSSYSSNGSVSSGVVDAEEGLESCTLCALALLQSVCPYSKMVCQAIVYGGGDTQQPLVEDADVKKFLNSIPQSYRKIVKKLNLFKRLLSLLGPFPTKQKTTSLHVIVPVLKILCSVVEGIPKSQYIRFLPVVVREVLEYCLEICMIRSFNECRHLFHTVLQLLNSISIVPEIRKRICKQNEFCLLLWISQVCLAAMEQVMFPEPPEIDLCQVFNLFNHILCSSTDGTIMLDSKCHCYIEVPRCIVMCLHRQLHIVVATTPPQQVEVSAERPDIFRLLQGLHLLQIVHSDIRLSGRKQHYQQQFVSILCETYKLFKRIPAAGKNETDSCLMDLWTIDQTPPDELDV